MHKYVWLIETIDRAKKITFKELNERWHGYELNDGSDLPERTFHKWKKEIEDIFGLVIKNENKGEYCYYIENRDELTNKGFKRWLLDTISTSNLVLSNMSLKDRILLENVPSGREHLKSIIEAIKENRMLRIFYHNYNREEEKEHCVMPLCLKLFHQRWYLVVRQEETAKTYILSLDRICGLELDQTFKYPKDFDPENFFYGSFGIIAGDDIPIETVVLKTTAWQAKYFRDLPLHQSQKETESNKDFSVFELRVHLSYDLKNEILSYGAGVEVLEPLSLRNEIAEEIQKMWNLYKK